MPDVAIELDQHRSRAERNATELRRRRRDVEADQAALRQRRSELEKLMLAAPAASWPEAVEKVRYLIGLFALTAAAREPRRQKLIASVLNDLETLAPAT